MMLSEKNNDALSFGLIVNLSGIAERFDVSRPTVSNWIKRYGSFPKPLEIPGVIGVPLYLWPEVEAWHSDKWVSESYLGRHGKEEGF
jgi:predicted DNA-binding transcriptional regulator AlpA